MNRRTLLEALLAGGAVIAHGAWAAAPVVEVYKSASCGCCHLWVQHLEKNGFVVRVSDVANPSDYRRKFGVPDALGSCHTGVVDGYALEGPRNDPYDVFLFQADGKYAVHRHYNG